MKDLEILKAASIKWQARAKSIELLLDKVNYKEGIEDEVFYRQLTFIKKECHTRALIFENEYLTILTEEDQKELYTTPLL